ncbi:MAG: HAMP domain-containing histidine kinase, partial [Oscillospiraceae bacterium]|nr:HAMP domain-containing histidine kinase [Oscillospiraceae bacterium]
MKKYIEDEIFRGVLIGLLGVDMLLVIIQSYAINGAKIYLNDFVLSLCIIAGLALFAMIIRSAGHYRGKEEVTPNYFDRYPLEIYAVGDGAVILCSLAVFRWTIRINFWPVALTFLGIAYLGAIFGCMSVAVRCKTHSLVTNTLVYRSFAAVGRFFRKISDRVHFYFDNISLCWQIVAVMCSVCLITFFCGAMFSMETGMAVGFFVLIMATLWLAGMAISFKKITEGIEKIASGDTSYQIDTKNMPRTMSKQAQHLNNVNTVVSEAVSKRIKSEQFRTELITNVSHDIKTPLTSIISYIDLIQKENITQQPVADYVNVLQRQSTRLKKLIDDLVEASKASTGNIAVNLATTGLSLLLNQATGEYADRAENRGLQLSMQLPENEVYVLSDGRLLWRIFDNLLNNACKY